MKPSLVTEAPAPQLVHTTLACCTNASKIIELEQQIQDLQEHITRLEHPGTMLLATILKYPFPKPAPAGKEPQARPKNFTFGTLVTADSITKTLQDMEDVKEKKAEDLRLKKAQQATKKAEKAAEKECKRLERERALIEKAGTKTTGWQQVAETIIVYERE